jgi:hypothetical protein
MPAPILVASFAFEPPGVELLPGSFGVESFVDLTVPGAGLYRLTLADVIGGAGIERDVWLTWGTPTYDLTIPFAFVTRTFVWAPTGPNQIDLKVKILSGVDTDFQFPPPGYRVSVQVWRTLAEGT